MTMLAQTMNRKERIGLPFFVKAGKSDPNLNTVSKYLSEAAPTCWVPVAIVGTGARCPPSKSGAGSWFKGILQLQRNKKKKSPDFKTTSIYHQTRLCAWKVTLSYFNLTYRFSKCSKYSLCSLQVKLIVLKKKMVVFLLLVIVRSEPQPGRRQVRPRV